MTDPNLVKVFSPTGEMAEVSKLNARDLTGNSGWTYERLIAAATPAPKPAPVKPVAPEEKQTPAPAADETDQTEETNEDAETADLFTTVEQFDALEERDAVVAYLAKHFPDFKPHHLSKRDKLVEKAIELATAK